MIVVYTTIRLDPDRREEAMDRVAELVDHSRSEDGTVRYHATTDLADPNVVRFFEQYEDAAAAEAHAESEPYRRFMAALPDLASEPIETVQFEADDPAVVEFDPAEAVEAVE